MDTSRLKGKAKEYLHRLCNQIQNRRVGSEGNRMATSFFAETIKAFGFEVECPEFECMDWHSYAAKLTADGVSFNAQVSPYSLGVDIQAPLAVASAVANLETMNVSNKVLLMRGELTKEQFMPKNFPFFQAEDQQKVIHLLESKKPLAIITATTRNPEMAGALYPFPVFEDGDFDIPSAYVTEEEGVLLAEFDRRQVSVRIDAERIPSHGCNVIAQKGTNPHERVVLFAHIDAKLGTPGALDNGTGIVTLLILAELLGDYKGSRTIEIVALNGEDYYSNPGEQLYLKQNECKFHEIVLGINIDGMGYIKGKTAYSLYNCPQEMANVVAKTFSEDETYLAGEPWFQGDHALFLMNQRPALALTSELVGELMAKYVHTEKDLPAIVNYEKVARTGFGLHRLLMNLCNK